MNKVYCEGCKYCVTVLDRLDICKNENNNYHYEFDTPKKHISYNSNSPINIANKNNNCKFFEEK